MLAWLSANAATVLICLALAAIVAAIVVHLLRDRRKGKTSCGCGCKDCPMSSSCHAKAK